MWSILAERFTEAAEHAADFFRFVVELPEYGLIDEILSA